MAEDFLAYFPPDYGRGKYPLIVYLHGSGECGYDPSSLQDCGPFASIQDSVKVPAVIVGPQCIPRLMWRPDSIARFVDVVESKYAIDRKRIYLVGYSMGGYGTWQTAAAYPELFAAIVPISGGGDPNVAKSLTELPIWAFHGENDTAVPKTECEATIEAIEAAGGQPKVTIMTDAGHEICEDVCRRADLWAWLLSHCASAPRPLKP